MNFLHFYHYKCSESSVNIVMIKGAETCETRRRQEICNVRDIFNFINDDQINVFRNTEKINKKLDSLTYSINFNETYIYVCVYCNTTFPMYTYI